MENLRYCRVCLATDIKMYSCNAKFYSELAQIPLHQLEDIQHVCYECAGLLYKYHKFKSKCSIAHSILMKFKFDSTKVTKQQLQNVNRKQNHLESTLTFSPVSTCSQPSNESDNKDINITQTNCCNDENNAIKTEAELCVNADLDDTSVDECLDVILNDEDTKSHKSISQGTKSKRKSKTIKEPKTKKQKLNKDNESDDNSDDEPLSKSITNNEVKGSKVRKRNGLNISYFEDYATVVFLTPEDARNEVMLRKESRNYKKSPFKCDKCYRGYEAKAAFENHMKKHSIENGEYECELCHLRFPQQIYLCKHRLSCHKRKFSCKLCPYICYCTYQAKTHVSLHKGKKYPCQDCGEIFSMPNSLLMHKSMKHLEESSRETVCEHCGSIFGTPRGLLLHSMKVHRQDKNNKQGPKCDECGVHFSSEVAWKRHLVLSTKHHVSNGCKCCGETFRDSEELKRHARAHSRKHHSVRITRALPARCEHCDKCLRTRAEYKAHVTSEHPASEEANKLLAEDLTPFVCEVCGQMFKQQCFLTYHQRKHTGERPYKCHDCGKTFQLAGALSIHKSIHTRKRAHKCDMCGRVFTFKSALNKHIKMHLGIRPHKCAICDKGFIHMCDLRLHIKYVHDKVPWPKKKSKRVLAEDNVVFSEYN